jgi:hypothetical protein
MKDFDDFENLEDFGFSEDSHAECNSEPFDAAAWEAHLEELGKRITDTRWQLGDWLLKGEPHYPSIGAGEIQGMAAFDIYSIAEGTTGIGRSALRELARVAKRFPASLRSESCTWAHHRVLARLIPNADDNTLKEWLTRAADERMSVADLRKSIDRPRELTKARSFIVTVSLKVWETLKDFADYEHSSVQTIAAQWLTENAESDVTQASRELALAQTEERRREKRRKVGKRLARAYDALGLNR